MYYLPDARKMHLLRRRYGLGIVRNETSQKANSLIPVKESSITVRTLDNPPFVLGRPPRTRQGSTHVFSVEIRSCLCLNNDQANRGSSVSFFERHTIL